MSLKNTLNKYKTIISKVKFFHFKNSENEHFVDDYIKKTACLSHELKTPLSSILSFCDILNQSENLSEQKLKKYISNIHICAKYLFNLIENILDTTQIEYSRFNPKDVIEEIVFMFETELKKTEIQLRLNLINVELVADVKKFKQIIYNLFLNALKFSNDNGKIIILSYTDDKYYYFEISDNGVGIKKENLNKIFDFFFTEKNEKNPNGSGIGLAICKKIMELHNAKIICKSKINVGTTFILKFPLKN